MHTIYCQCKLISERPDSMISRISELQIMKTNPWGLSVKRQILLLAALSGSSTEKQMKSVSIKSLGRTMLLSEATYAPKVFKGT